MRISIYILTTTLLLLDLILMLPLSDSPTSNIHQHLSRLHNSIFRTNTTAGFALMLVSFIKNDTMFLEAHGYCLSTYVIIATIIPGTIYYIKSRVDSGCDDSDVVFLVAGAFVVPPFSTIVWVSIGFGIKKIVGKYVQRWPEELQELCISTSTEIRRVVIDGLGFHLGSALAFYAVFSLVLFPFLLLLYKYRERGILDSYAATQIRRRTKWLMCLLLLMLHIWLIFRVEKYMADTAMENGGGEWSFGQCLGL
jgi:hypothetical protein